MCFFFWYYNLKEVSIYIRALQVWEFAVGSRIGMELWNAEVHNQSI